MIRYKKYQNSNPKSTACGKWFGRAVHELMEFEEFITHMADHHCVFSEATIRGVLIEMETCLRELLLEGKAVRLDQLGIFRIGLETEGKAAASKFTASDIKGVHVNLYLGKRFLASDLFKSARFKEADVYVGFDETDPETDGGNAATEEGGGSQDSGQLTSLGLFQMPIRSTIRTGTRMTTVFRTLKSLPKERTTYIALLFLVK